MLTIQTITNEITNEKEVIDLLDPNNERRYNKKLKRSCNFYEIKDLLLSIDDQLTTAINLYYLLDQFYKEKTLETAREELDSLIQLYASSGISHLIDFSHTLIRWKKEIIHSFIIIDEKTKRKVNNGIIENRNKIIKQIKHNSNGYRNWNRFRNRALFVLNEDTTFYLYPQKPKEK